MVELKIFLHPVAIVHMLHILIVLLDLNFKVEPTLKMIYTIHTEIPGTTSPTAKVNGEEKTNWEDQISMIKLYEGDKL